MPRILFITGKLAEPSLRKTLEELAPRAGFEFDIEVLPITVVALAPVAWIARHLSPREGYDRVILPGLCLGDLPSWPHATVERGPKDLRDLPEYFGQARARKAGYGRHDIAILAEINHAPRLTMDDIETRARKAVADGADIVDLGCDPGSTWTQVGEAVSRLRDQGMRVSLDSFNPLECAGAAKAGAELILSVNAQNREACRDWGCEVVAVPDVPAQMQGLDETVAYLAQHQVPFRIDPILEPIGFGFAASLGRYLQARERFPEAETLMGVGNLTELTEVDAAGVNVLLLAICQEVGIRSVLTTEVINWARSSVRELDLARRLVYHAVKEQMVPKNLDASLVMLRDPRLREHGLEVIAGWARQVTDPNFRIFAEAGVLHVFNRDMHLKGDDPFVLFEEMRKGAPIDASHAFYLGYEMAKAITALTLGKNYVQDQALNWGFLTRPENTHHGS